MQVHDHQENRLKLMLSNARLNDTFKKQEETKDEQVNRQRNYAYTQR